MKNTFKKFWFGALIGSMAVASAYAADGDDTATSKEKKPVRQLVSSSVTSSEKPVPRIWFGLTGSITPMKLVKGNDGLQDTTTGDVFSSKTANGQIGGGAILNTRIFRGFGLSLGAIYRFTGYDATAVLNDTNGTVNIERGRMRLVDFPIMIRYDGRKFNSKHTFYELGASLREVMSFETTTNSRDGVTGELGVGPKTGISYKHMVPGATAGFGLIGRDDFGIIVSPEVRYTRWMSDTFISPTGASNLVTSQRNQLEVTVSIGF